MGPRLFKSRHCFLLMILIFGFITVDIILWRHFSNMKNKNSTKNLELPPVLIQQLIKKRNTAHKIQNTAMYGLIKENTMLFVVHMDMYSHGLNSFLASLSEVEGIADALLIFSHSYYDENVNKIIRDIDFCRVLQIFFPFSLQTHPHVFPGRDPNDCPTHMTKEKATAMNCTGALYPDFRGHYRDPQLAEKKHHWWWTCNMVFEKLGFTSKEIGLVVFLEHDLYLTKDFMYMAMYMKNVAESQPQCEFLSMGKASHEHHAEEYFYAAELSTWTPNEYPSALAFDLNTWNIIVSHYNLFCSVDESSWFRSLYYISLNRKDGKPFKVMSSVMPRSHKISPSNLNCVVDHKSFTWLNESEEFPSHIELYINVEIDEDTEFIFDYKESLGGWADPRDKKLCIKITKKKIKKVLMEMETST